MLQLERLNRRARKALDAPRARPASETAEDLERRADAAVAELREKRRALASGLGRVMVAVDDFVRTDVSEHLDDPAFPAEHKLRIVRGIHRMNAAVFAYDRFFHALAPHLRRVISRENRPVRVLELAAGSGEFSFALAARANRRKLAVEVTGSDFEPTYVEAANREARRRGLSVPFRELNAFAMHEVDDGAYDVAFIAQSIHHFTPGQLAKAIAECGRVARYAFVGVDLRRSLFLFPFGIGVAALTRDPAYMHDSVVSMRKAYSEAELALVAEVAAPSAHVCARPQHPLYSVLTVEYR
jgi:SAM-dependent methyltransferase